MAMVLILFGFAVIKLRRH